MAMSVQKPPHPSQMDPRLRHAVYAKYREMLVSKNPQANEMIKKLPAYMVREDRGFNTTNVIVNDVPPPPPCPGNLPTHRLQTQMSEAPACVQNAMMTKDKKPFTYTPGGIDLSQIKSPRMAKRISMNANSPGVSNTPKMSPLAQISNGNNSPSIQSPKVQNSTMPTPPPAPPMGQFAMGMPFQVLPPPPPPPPMKMEQPQKLSPPQTNGNAARKSPQSFDPPPMGCRPEIKIPENPMAILRKVGKPQQKDTFWVEEFIRDSPKSPPIMSPPIQQQREYVSTPPIQQQREYVSTPPIQQQREYVSIPPISQKPSTPIQQYLPQQRRSPSPERQEIRNIKLEDVRSASPTRVQVNRSSPVVSSSPITVAKQVVMEPIQQPRPLNYQQPSQGGKIILSTMPNRPQQAPQNLGSLYIPPPMTNLDDKQYLLSQQSPPWMSTKQMSDTPEWVNRDELDNFIQQTRMMHAQPKEHVIPIAMEKTPTTMPNYGPTPFYGTPQQHIQNFIQPKVDPNANKFVNQGYNEYNYPTKAPQQNQQRQQPGTRIIPIQVEGARASPNDNNNTATIVMKSDPWQPPSPRINAFGAPSQSRSFKILQQVTNTFGDDPEEITDESKQLLDDAPMQEQTPIYSRPLEAKDMNDSQFRRLQLSENDRALMNRVKQQVDDEIYLHSESDPRYKGSAIPSRAFKALQTMTDGAPNNVAVPPGRPMQRAAQEEEQPQREPGLYQGSAIPSRSFKILQAMTQPENAADCNDNSSDIEVPPAMIPPQPFMVPPQYYYDWYDPQNNPWAYYYPPPGFDPSYFGYAPSQSRSQTPQPQPQPQAQSNMPYPPYFYHPYPFVILPPFMGFRPISTSRETTPCFSEADRYQMSSSMSDDRNRRAVSCTPTCCQHAKSFPIEDNRSKFNTVEEPILRPVPIRSETPPKPPDDEEPFNELKSIPSIDNLNELHVQPIVTEDDDRSEASEDTTEVEEEISQDTETVEIHYPHQLSVIYEENESLRRSSVCSRSSTLSDCSTTLMEDDNISDDELNEDEENSVTVRLPLKFSFTRSKDNIVNTTLTVGESKSEATECEEINRSHSLSNTSSANDVSVTFSLKSKSKTPERLINPSLSVKCDNIEEEDRECSVSISLPVKRKSIDERRNSGSNKEDLSDGSGENKNNVDASLYTSLDALEEIKRGMLDINNSLFSRICTMRKSALNIPEHDNNRSGSVSYIDSIESDSDNESSSFNDYKNEGRRKSSFGIDGIKEEEVEVEPEDFWSQISTRNQEDHNLSKTSTNSSSKYWFEDDNEPLPPADDGFARYEINEVTTSVSFVSLNEQEINEGDDHEEVDYWKDYDPDRDLRSNATKFFESRDENETEKTNGIEDNKSEFDDDSDTESCKDFMNDLKVKELASDEEWTEEEIEVTDNDEPQLDSESKKEEDSESEYEEEEPPKPSPQPIVHIMMDHKPCKLITIKTMQVEIQQPIVHQNISETDEESSSEESEMSEPPPQRSNESSSSRISKGKSLVNVNSFIVSEAMSEMKQRLDQHDSDDEKQALPDSSPNIINVSHSNDDCQVLLPQIHSIDSKSNMTSESGVSFEQHENDSDGYEEDSEEEIINENEKTITRDTLEDDDDDEIKVNVKNKISMFERAMSEERCVEKQSKEVPRVPAKYSFKFRESSEPPETKVESKNQKLIELINQRKSLPPTLEIDSDANEKRENYKRFGKSCPLVRSIDESGEEDSGFSCKQFSETETDSENFPELRKLSRYERASTHSRLFKLLQGDEEIPEKDEDAKESSTKIPYKSKKIVHNVSVTRRQNPQAALQAETMEERRQRLCLPLTHQSSSGAESMSSSTTPSPTPVNEKLVQELVQSLLSQKRGRSFRNLPLDKLHAAAVKILQEDMESNGTLSSADESTVPTVDSTPALTPQEFRNSSSYSEYYDSWNNHPQGTTIDEITADVIQSKAFRNLQEQQSNANKKMWAVRCPRILSSKSINKDLARVSEVRESESPEPNHSRSLSTEPMSGGDKCIVNHERQMANT